MKKFLCGAATLLATGLVTSSVDAAEPLRLIINGNMQEWFGVVKHEEDNGQAFNTFGINTDNEVSFKALSILDNGVEAEAFVRLNVYNNDAGPDNNKSPGLDEQWIALGGTFGKIYAGAKDSINESLHHQPVDHGIGYGDVNVWVKPPVAGVSSNLLVGSRDRTSFGMFADAAPMVGYISPKFAGLQLGLTYSPNPTTLGTHDYSEEDNGTKDHWDVTLAYSREFQGVSVGLDSGYAHKDLPISNDMKAWNTGLKLGYSGFTLGASLMQVQLPGTNVNDGYGWNTGLSYANGPWGVSYTYFQERRRGDHLGGNDNEKFRTHLVSGKYAIGPGVKLKSSAFYGKYDGQDDAVDNQNTWGYGLVSGLDINF